MYVNQRCSLFIRSYWRHFWSIHAQRNDEWWSGRKSMHSLIIYSSFVFLLQEIYIFHAKEEETVTMGKKNVKAKIFLMFTTGFWVVLCIRIQNTKSLCVIGSKLSFDSVIWYLINMHFIIILKCIPHWLIYIERSKSIKILNRKQSKWRDFVNVLLCRRRETIADCISCCVPLKPLCAIATG